MADSNYGYRFLLVGMIVATNGFFAAAEVSILRSRRSRLQQLAEEGESGAKAAIELLDNPGRLLSVGQIGVTICSLGLGWAGEESIHHLALQMMHPMVTPVTEKIIDFIALCFSFALMTYMHVVLGEVVPKNIGIETADRLAVLVSPILLFCAKVASPLVTLIERSSTGISRGLGLKGELESGGHSVEELKFIVSTSRHEGEIEHFEEAAIKRLLELQNYSAREVMVPRHRMVAVPVSSSLDHVLLMLNEHQYSRLPVFESSPDQVIGIVHLKDLVQVWMQRRNAYDTRRYMLPFRLRTVMRAPLFVPETKSLNDLIDEFRAHNTHMAVVVDEHGSTSGVVTLEDVLEQVFGEIDDEHDVSRPKPNVNAQAVELDGGINIPDLAHEYGIELPPDGGFETLAGFLLSRLGNLPQPGTVVEYAERRFTVIEMERNRIARVRVEKKLAAV